MNNPLAFYLLSFVFRWFDKFQNVTEEAFSTSLECHFWNTIMLFCGLIQMSLDIFLFYKVCCDLWLLSIIIVIKNFEGFLV